MIEIDKISPKSYRQRGRRWLSDEIDTHITVIVAPLARAKRRLCGLSTDGRTHLGRGARNPGQSTPGPSNRISCGGASAMQFQGHGCFASHGRAQIVRSDANCIADAKIDARWMNCLISFHGPHRIFRNRYPQSCPGGQQQPRGSHAALGLAARPDPG